MKRRALLLLAALCLAPAPAIVAQSRGAHVEISNLSEEDPGRLGPRRSPREARLAITTTNDVASLLLTREVVAMQLTDRTLREIRDDVEDERREEGFFARMIESAVRGTVHSMLRRSFEYPIRDIRSVDYRGGRLVFTTEEGERIFEDVEVNGSEMMESFSAADARAFVREFRALKAASR